MRLSFDGKFRFGWKSPDIVRNHFTQNLGEMVPRNAARFPAKYGSSHQMTVALFNLILSNISWFLAMHSDFQPNNEVPT